MNSESSEFNKLLEKATNISHEYVYYSPSQIDRGDHLKNDPTLGERSWSIPETTGKFLYKIITKLNLRSALELGTSTGYSTLWIATALSEQSDDWKLITIERNLEKQKLAQELLQDPFSDHIHFENSFIENYLPTISHMKFDLIFMDAERGKYKEYWNYIKGFLHEKSIVIIDNALRSQKSVIEFQDFLKSDSSLSTYLHPMDNGLFIVTLSSGDYTNLQDIIGNI
jgi:predicted O-methyltransferase YrrM